MCRSRESLCHRKRRQIPKTLCVDIQGLRGDELSPWQRTRLLALNGTYHITTGRYYATTSTTSDSILCEKDSRCFQYIQKSDNKPNDTHRWAIGTRTVNGEDSQYLVFSEKYPIDNPLPVPTTIMKWYTLDIDGDQYLLNPPNGKQIITPGSCA